MNGIDLISKMQIEMQSLLVRNRYHKQDVLEQCEELGIKLLPKDMAALIPLTDGNNLFEL